MTLTGWHHFTGATAQPAACTRFYRDRLGLRLVKLTVNYDDPTSYHLYFANEAGTPGTVMTFFHWDNARRGKPGVGHPGIVRLAVQGALSAWQQKLPEAKESTTPLSEPVLTLEDPDGLRIELLSVQPGEPKVLQLHSVAAHGYRRQSTLKTAEGVLGLRVVTLTPDVMRLGFAGQEGNGQDKWGGKWGGQYFDVIGGSTSEGSAGATQGAPGVGVLHHVAVATSVEDHPQWPGQLTQNNIRFSGILDRTYFRSIYFREPGGVLIEIASAGPGFDADEPMESLGTKLVLPDWLEPRRQELLQILPPL